MFTDEDRLAMIRSQPDAVLVRVPQGEFWATFDNESIEILNSIETRTPTLSDCLTSDIERLSVIKDDPVEVAGTTYRVKRHEPSSGGWSRVILKR